MRDYKKEYANYQGKPEQIARRSSRNKARLKIKKTVGAVAIKGKDIDHKDRNPNNNSRSNLRISSVKKNRGRNG
tara:strand:+ start:233 stop:454 length:222 start_codon:yes stop_codon:yes gene_type:complete